MVDNTTPLPNPEGPDDETICWCIGVSRGEILQAMREKGCRNLDTVCRATRAMGGCMTCRYDIEAIIRAELARQEP
ncbi:MAG: hypothetical protein EA402_10050 [Planctomycetota bacterium]|nr:MAG: hypothetical protein EA402_10050 [Planctomycetota bacterium]